MIRRTRDGLEIQPACCPSCGERDQETFVEQWEKGKPPLRCGFCGEQLMMQREPILFGLVDDDQES